jgi:hypothetical protein
MRRQGSGRSRRYGRVEEQIDGEDDGRVEVRFAFFPSCSSFQLTAFCATSTAECAAVA